MAQQIAGTAFVKADGVQFTLAGSMTVVIDEREREMLSGLGGVAGYKETLMPPKIEGEFFLTADLSMEDIGNITDATVTAELANGRTYLIRNAVATGRRELNAAEGTVQITFEGLGGEEL